MSHPRRRTPYRHPPAAAPLPVPPGGTAAAAPAQPPPGMPLPRPPAALPAAWLPLVPAGRRITVAGLVLVRQRPGTAKGVVFVTLEDETGVVNVVVWAKVFERFRRAVIAARLMRVTGRLERQSGVSHVIAERIEDISPLLDTLAAPPSPSHAPEPGGTGRPP